MNNLNSSLTEGELINDLYTETYNGNTVYKFTIASNRFFNEGDSLNKEVSFFNVEAGKKIAESGKLKKGRSVRVVGRLKNEHNDPNRIVIVAEHIEVRPELKEAGED